MGARVLVGSQPRPRQDLLHWRGIVEKHLGYLAQSMILNLFHHVVGRLVNVHQDPSASADVHEHNLHLPVMLRYDKSTIQCPSFLT